RGRRWPARRSLQRQLPGLADQVVAEAVVALAGGQHIAFLAIEVARGAQHVVGPEPDAAVARLAREAAAFGDQPRTDAEPACARLDEQQAQLRDTRQRLA